MRWPLIAIVILGGMIAAVQPVAANDPGETIRHSEQVLGELMAIPGRQIPQRLLDHAQGVVIVPDVIKIGFVAGVRRGHGVVMVRDADGEWSLPQFLTLTGGSFGWQAGIQGTDVVLVFTSRKGIDGLMRGKFTIGVDAAATAGPIGRDTEVGTDGKLQSEIFSYSRSRGLFLGVSIDGSVLEVDPDAHFTFYGLPPGQVPRHLPESAARLRNSLAELTHTHPAHPAAGATAGAVHAPIRIETLRRLLTNNAIKLQTILSPEWRHFLAFPKEFWDPNAHPSIEALAAVQNRFSEIESSPSYKELTQRLEFQATHELLREYIGALSAARPSLQLPPPPAQSDSLQGFSRP